MPALNEGEGIEKLLRQVQSLRAQGQEVIVVDGGSGDDTRARAECLADHVLDAGPGRARQMNAGTAVASGRVLWFVHADSEIPAAGGHAVLDAVEHGHVWGRFDVRLSGGHWMFRIIEGAMNLRSRLTGIATGDQGIFVTRALFDKVGGYPEIALMEDIALSRRLKRHGRPACLEGPMVTSSRRWETQGIWRTVFLMWRLRLAYWLGRSPEELARRYHGDVGHR